MSHELDTWMSHELDTRMSHELDTRMSHELDTSMSHELDTWLAVSIHTTKRRKSVSMSATSHQKWVTNSTHDSPSAHRLPRKKRACTRHDLCTRTSHELFTRMSQQLYTFLTVVTTRRTTRRWHTDCQRRKEHLCNTIFAHEPVTNSTHDSPLAHSSPREKHAKSSPSWCKTRQFTVRGEQTIRKKERIKQAIISNRM